MKKTVLVLVVLLATKYVYAWGFFAHQKINYYAVFLLPPEMIAFYKPHIDFLSEHAVDPDKRRYAVAQEGTRHFIDIDRYGPYPYSALPRKWDEAVAKFSEDSLMAAGIVPWWIERMERRLVNAFKEKDGPKILKLSAEIGHYIADAHVPLHASSNHNGQLTGQQGIHGFWESRIPELLSASSWDFFIGKADFIEQPLPYIWNRVLESAAAADTVLTRERELTASFSPDQKFAFEKRNETLVKQYSSAFSSAYDMLLNGMIERRMRLSIYSVASFWFTAWVEAGQPKLAEMTGIVSSDEDGKAFEELNRSWRNGNIIGRKED
ncbi:MAG TPA: zinc dependent phospholipase C family protein [Flavisolibacter sp.]|nr:zinc dependent phospholipase C family protein [Flavisolibacter sp.]